MLEIKHVRFSGKLVFVGFGSVGQGVLPLILRHIDLKPEQISIVTADERGREEAARYGIAFQISPLTRGNFREILVPRISKGDFLLNLSVDVSSVALMELCSSSARCISMAVSSRGPAGYTDTSLSPSLRSNYAMREAALELRRKHWLRPDDHADPRRKSRLGVELRQAGIARRGARYRSCGETARVPRSLGTSSPWNSA